ncbi:MAG: hypothetical protein J7L92_04640 [Dehalococcoidia bacterium]|nr:hypothetical protein [Dehalococcoidia bacterium]
MPWSRRATLSRARRPCLDKEHTPNGAGGRQQVEGDASRASEGVAGAANRA